MISVPYLPALSGIEEFAGRILHSRDFRQPADFKGNNILIIGLGYSAQDIAQITHRNGASRIICSWKASPMGYKWPKGIEERPKWTDLRRTPCVSATALLQMWTWWSSVRDTKSISPFFQKTYDWMKSYHTTLTICIREYPEWNPVTIDFSTWACRIRRSHSRCLTFKPCGPANTSMVDYRFQIRRRCCEISSDGARGMMRRLKMHIQP